MSQTLTISFAQITPTPAAGYRIKYWPVSNPTNITTLTATSSPKLITGLSEYSYAGTVEVGCGANIYSTAQPFTATAVNTCVLGTSFQGGKIAYIFVPGDPGYVTGECHGLIVGTVLGPAPWGCVTLNTMTTNPNLGYGSFNTDQIVAACSQSGIAAKLCLDLVQGGYSDWYLPSKEELNKVYISQGSTGIFSFTSVNYWSSTGDSSIVGQAWAQAFGSGTQFIGFKDVSYSVLPVRTF